MIDVAISIHSAFVEFNEGLIYLALSVMLENQQSPVSVVNWYF